MLQIKKFLLSKRILLLKKKIDYNLIILKEIVIMAGISNHTIVDFIEKKTSDDVKKNFAGVCPSNYVTRFITFRSMMAETGASYPFIILNTDHSDKKAHIGGVFWIYIQKKKSFYKKCK